MKNDQVVLETTASFFFHILMMELQNHSRIVEDSVAFGVSLLSGLQHCRELVLQLCARKLDDLLPEVSSQQDFAILIKFTRILEHRFLSNDTTDAIIKRLTQKVVTALAEMPDDGWRVRVLAQLTKPCIVYAFESMSPDMSDNVLHYSRSILGGERIYSALGMDLETA